MRNFIGNNIFFLFYYEGYGLGCNVVFGYLIVNYERNLYSSV